MGTCRVTLLLALAGLALGCSSTNLTNDPDSSGGASNSCAPGQQLCDGVCLDVTANPAHCGSCGATCAVGASCVAGQCACQGNLTNCDGTCVDLRGDGTHCGDCTTVCTGNLVCSAGVCQSSCTAAGQTACATSCVDLNSDPANCGTCGTPCPVGAVCAASVCVCPTGTSLCGGSCTDTATDALNCGGCGLICGAGQACTAGLCTGGGTGGAGAGGTGGSTGGNLTGGAAPTGGVGAGGTGGVTYGTEALIEEEQLGFCSVDGVVEATNLGFSGTGYANTDNAAGTAIEWAVRIGESGPYTLDFTYANAGADRSANVLVDEATVGTGLSFPATADWTTWSTVSTSVTLDAGYHHLALAATSAEGLANIDHVTVSGAAVNAADCDDPGGAGGTGGTGGTGGAPTGGSGGAKTCGVTADGHYQMEDLSRGVVAVNGGNGNYVGWRMYGYEYSRSDPASVTYNLYRDGTLVANVADSTNYWDAGASSSAAYSVSAVVNGAECEQSAPVTPWSSNYIRVPLSSPGNHEANDASPGDLDGDGDYELILKWQPANAKDNSQSGVTDNTYLDALELDGTQLWRIDLGRNIRSGAHYTQMSVYDFDGDGRAEIAVKTAPGTRDGTGAYLSLGPAANDDDGADYRNSGGYILDGPEYLTVFDGLTGAELATIAYPVPRGNVGAWGDDYGNRLDRYNAGVAMVTDLGGSASGRPSIIRQRGYYTRLTMSALNWRDGQLTTAWIFDSDSPGNGAAFGQGDHSAMTADMDGDLAQEITTGALTIGSDGTLRCTTGRGHGDALHVGELVVGQGISVFTVYEGAGGYSVHNGNTCVPYVEVLGGDDNGRGVADDVHPGNPGGEFWSATSSSLMSCTNGSNVGSEPQSQNFLIYWDADDSRELQDGAWIGKYGGGDLLNASGCSGNNGTKNTPTLTADLVGDWREELVVRETNNSALRVYTTTDVTTRRIYTLMHDPTYRMQVTFEQASYNQPPHPGFHIGDGMADPPEPNIHVR